MAYEAVMKYGLRRIAQALKEYAEAQGWGPEAYRVHVHMKPDLSLFYVIVVAKEFPGRDRNEKWLAVIDFLEKKLKDEPELFKSTHLVLRTFDQVAEGGLYAITPRFVEINELLNHGFVAEAMSPSFSLDRRDW